MYILLHHPGEYHPGYTKARQQEKTPNTFTLMSCTDSNQFAHMWFVRAYVIHVHMSNVRYILWCIYV